VQTTSFAHHVPTNVHVSISARLMVLEISAVSDVASVEIAAAALCSDTQTERNYTYFVYNISTPL
jgi:hypothetical protein